MVPEKITVPFANFAAHKGVGQSSAGGRLWGRKFTCYVTMNRFSRLGKCREAPYLGIRNDNRSRSP